MDLLAVAWLRIDKRFEGPTLIRLSGEHGFVLADICAVAALALAVWAFWRRR